MQKIKVTVVIVNLQDGTFTSRIISSSKADYLLSVRAKHFNMQDSKRLTDDDIECYMMDELSECFVNEHIINVEDFLPLND